MRVGRLPGRESRSTHQTDQELDDLHHGVYMHLVVTSSGVLPRRESRRTAWPRRWSALVSTTNTPKERQGVRTPGSGTNESEIPNLTVTLP
jgi:hypothetical protein